MSITEETRREGHEAIDKAKRQAMILGCLHGRHLLYYSIFQIQKNNPDKQEIFLEFRDYSIILCLFLFQSYDRE